MTQFSHDYITSMTIMYLYLLISPPCNWQLKFDPSVRDLISHDHLPGYNLLCELVSLVPLPQTLYKCCISLSVILYGRLDCNNKTVQAEDLSCSTKNQMSFLQTSFVIVGGEKLLEYMYSCLIQLVTSSSVYVGCANSAFPCLQIR